MSSSIISILPILSVLFTLDQQLPTENSLWEGSSAVHRSFLSEYYNPNNKYNELEILFSNKELHTKFSYDLEKINTFLNENNINTTFEDAGQNALYLASTLNFNVKKSGKFLYRIIIAKNFHSYMGIRISDPNNFTCFKCKKHSRTICCITSKHGETIYLTPAFEEDTTPKEAKIPYKDLALFQHVNEISQDIRQGNIETEQFLSFNYVCFPGIRYECASELSWLTGLEKNNYHIAQAVQNIKFSTIKKDARLKKTHNQMKEDDNDDDESGFIIDEPMYVWVEKNNMILLAGYFDEKSWVYQPIKGQML